MTNTTSKIGKRAVDALAIPDTGENRLWDSELKGFFVRAYAGGRKVYAVRYRRGASQRVYTIGVHGSPWTPDQARKEASEILARVRMGDDPAAAKRKHATAITVATLIERYLEDGPATKPSKRASTWTIDASNLRRHILPLLGRKIANEVTRADAAKAIKDITDGKTRKVEKTGLRGRARVMGGAGTARRTRTTAAAMFAWGIEHGHVETNPFSGIRLAAAPTRERFLTASEAGRLLSVLGDLEGAGEVSRTFGDAIRLLLLTGARKTEILGLRWSEVDLGRLTITLPPERTKAGGRTGERRIALSPPAASILADRRKIAEGAFVFPSAKGEGHAIGLRRAFVKVRDTAGQPDLRIHDLRHSYASLLIASGESLFLVGKALGHASARTTERYAHLADDPLQSAASKVAKMLGQQLHIGGPTPSEDQGATNPIDERGPTQQPERGLRVVSG